MVTVICSSLYLLLATMHIHADNMSVSVSLNLSHPQSSFDFISFYLPHTHTRTQEQPDLSPLEILEEQEKEKSGKEIKDFLSEQVSCFVSHIFLNPPRLPPLLLLLSLFHCFVFFFVFFFIFASLVFFSSTISPSSSYTISDQLTFLTSFHLPLTSTINHTIPFLTMLRCTVPY